MWDERKVTMKGDIMPLSEAEVGEVNARLGQVRRDREGVAMFLVLEDLAPDAEPADPTGEGDGAELARLAQRYREVLFPGVERLDEYGVAQVLELLAAAHFEDAR